MKTTLLLLAAVFSVTAIAGQDDYAREMEKAKVDHKYAVKSCRAQKKEPAADCIKRVDGYLKNAQKGLKAALQGAQK